MQRYDYLIVGAELFGSVFAYKATQEGKKCLVIDRRPHLGGNLYCEHWQTRLYLPVASMSITDIDSPKSFLGLMHPFSYVL